MSAIFYKLFVVSVWCFFAGLTSIVIYFILNEIHKGENSAVAATNN
jgi:hypothetical protein